MPYSMTQQHHSFGTPDKIYVEAHEWVAFSALSYVFIFINVLIWEVGVGARV